MKEQEVSLKMAEIFLKTAEKDLGASRHLWEGKFYPQAVFYLQQSVEKALKYLLLWTGIAGEDDVKKIGHKPQKLCIMIMTVAEKMRKDKFFGEILKGVFKDRGINFNRVMCKKIEEKELYSASLKSIDVIIDNHELKDERIKEWLESEQAQQIYLVLEKEFVKMLIEFGYSAQLLIYLFFVLAPHVTRSRYPVDDSDPLEIYNEGISLIQKFESLLKICEYILNNLKNIKVYPMSDDIRKILKSIRAETPK
ncbi:MAG: HEPN domain-containing protein [Thermoprotei archaeon]|nr:HEPN domain-containing protein [Thermoprotei archaeon]